MTLSEKNKGVISLIILAWVFATMGIFARYLDISFELFEQTYLRISMAFVFGIVIFYKNLDFGKLRGLSRKDVLVMIFRSVSLYAGVVLFTEAIIHTKYSNASFIATLPFMPLLGYVFLKETLKLRTLLYIGIGFVGLTLMVISDFALLKIGYGEIMAFFSMLAFNFSYIGRKWHSNYLNNYETTVFMFAAGAVFLFITSMLIGESLPTGDQFTILVIGALVGSTIFNVANLYLTNYGFQHVKVAVASNILTLEVVFALIYGLFVFREIPVLREVIGGLLILTSVFLVNRSER